MKVYLAGNIENLSYAEATNWREYVTYIFNLHRIECLDPMRDKDEHKNSLSINASESKLSLKDIFNRDIQDVQNCDLIFANFTKTGVGTPFELGYGYSLNKRIVIVTSHQLLNHPFLVSSSEFITTDLGYAMDYVITRQI